MFHELVREMVEADLALVSEVASGSSSETDDGLRAGGQKSGVAGHRGMVGSALRAGWGARNARS